MKYIIIIPDGASDYPISELGDKTPLEIANTPNMDKLAKNGFMGFTNNVPKGFTPGSDVANMSIFGYNPNEYYTGRGPLEAGSVGIETSKYDVIFRCNTIYTENGIMTDFNAGHISSLEVSKLFDGLNSYFNEKYPNFKGKFYPGISYRNLFVYSCDNEDESLKLSSLKTMPPHDMVNESLDDYRNWDDDLTIFIKKIMNESVQYLCNNQINKNRVKNNQIPANMVWLWGQGTTPLLPNFTELYGLKGAVITGVDLLKGIGVFAGLDIIEVPGATGYFDTNYKAKGKYAIKALENHDLVFVHIEAPDEAGHAQNIEEKVKSLEKIDKFIVEPIINSLNEDYKIAILPDHPTPIEVGTHTCDDIPQVIYSSKPHRKTDSSKVFTENGAKNGSIIKKEGYKLVSRLISNDF